MTINQDFMTEHDYETGFQDGWDACHDRFLKILTQHQSVPCNTILPRLPLHPSQPDQILEPHDWLMAQGGPERKKT